MRDEPRYAGFLRFMQVLLFSLAVIYGAYALNHHGVIDLPEIFMRAIDVELMR